MVVYDYGFSFNLTSKSWFYVLKPAFSSACLGECCTLFLSSIYEWFGWRASNIGNFAS